MLRPVRDPLFGRHEDLTLREGLVIVVGQIPFMLRVIMAPINPPTTPPPHAARPPATTSTAPPSVVNPATAASPPKTAPIAPRGAAAGVCDGWALMLKLFEMPLMAASGTDHRDLILGKPRGQ